MTGIGPALPSPTAPNPYVSPRPMLSPNATIGGGFTGFGGFGVGGFGYPGMYGGFGGPSGGFGMSMPPTPEFGFGAYRAGNQFTGPAAGMGMRVGVPADPNAPLAGNAGPDAIGGPSEDPFDAAAVADRPPGREIRSKRVHTGRRPTARKPAAPAVQQTRSQGPGSRAEAARSPQDAG